MRCDKIWFEGKSQIFNQKFMIRNKLAIYIQMSCSKFLVI